MSRLSKFFKKRHSEHLEARWRKRIGRLVLYKSGPRPYFRSAYRLTPELDRVFDSSCAALYDLMKRQGLSADTLKGIYSCYEEIHDMIEMNDRFQDRAKGLTEEELCSEPVQAAYKDIKDVSERLTEHVRSVAQTVGTETVIPKNLIWFQKEHEKNLKRISPEPMLLSTAKDTAYETDTDRFHALCDEIADARVLREARSCLDKAEDFTALAERSPSAAASESRVWNYLLPETERLLEKIISVQENENMISEKKGVFFEQAIEELRLLGKAFSARTERVKKSEAAAPEDLSSDIHVLKQVMAMDGDIEQIKEEEL